MSNNIENDQELHPRLTIVNSVVTANVGLPLPCKKIYMTTPNCEYNPKTFAACKHRVRIRGKNGEMCAPTFLIFPSGRIVCGGGRMVRDSRRAMKNFLEHMERVLGVEMEKNEITTQNIVAHTDLKQKIHLTRFAQKCQLRCVYEPELFPGLRMDVNVQQSIQSKKRRRICVNLFSSGKMVITGSTTLYQINEAYKVIKSILRQ